MLFQVGSVVVFWRVSESVCDARFWNSAQDIQRVKTKAVSSFEGRLSKIDDIVRTYVFF